MPIRGLTRREDVTPRFTRLGKIKKGTTEVVRDKGGRIRYRDGEPITKPVDLDYFRFIGEGSRAPAIEEAFHSEYGPEPREIDVLLPYKTADENWQTWMEEWGKSGLIHRCDGEVMVQWLTPDKAYVTDYRQEQNKPCPYFSGATERTTKSPGCVQVGRLAVMIPALLRAGFIGYVTVEIHSKNDLGNLTASLLDAEAKSDAAMNTNGLQGILFKLRRQPEEIGVRYERTRKENGRMVKTGEIIKTRSTKWMVRLDPAQEWVLYQLETSQQMALGQRIERPALTIGAEAAVITGIDAAELIPVEDADLQIAEAEIIGDALPESEEPLTLERAAEFTTPKGTAYGELTFDQLVVIIEAYSKEQAAGTLTEEQMANLRAAQLLRDDLKTVIESSEDPF